MSRVVAALGFAAAITSPTAARADLAPDFVSKLTVDTAYVQSAAGATDIAFSGDGRAVVTTKGGTVVVRRANGTRNTIAYPFGGTLDTASEKGLLGVVADPNVAQNHTFYFYVSNGPTADKHRVLRAVLTPTDTLTVDPTPVVALSRGVGPGLEGPANHAGGGMIIHGGRLYLGVGDTGANASPPVNKYGSCLNKGNGKILRVNLDGSVPADNPLVGVASVSACSTTTGPWTAAAPDQRVYAWGLRNPWRFWADPQTSLLWIGDVGENAREEISIGGSGVHHGYPFVEGDQVWGNVDGLNCTSLTPSRSCTPPGFAYSHALGSAVTGGLIPSGCGWSSVFPTPHYVFGDSGSGFIAALPVNAARSGFSSTSLVDVADYGGAPVSFRMGPDGALYVVFFALGSVYRFAPSNQAGCPATAVPSGNFTSTAVLALALGLAGLLLLQSRVRRGLAIP